MLKTKFELEFLFKNQPYKGKILIKKKYKIKGENNF